VKSFKHRMRMAELHSVSSALGCCFLGRKRPSELDSSTQNGSSDKNPKSSHHHHHFFQPRNFNRPTTIHSTRPAIPPPHLTHQLSWIPTPKSNTKHAPSPGRAFFISTTDRTFPQEHDPYCWEQRRLGFLK
jgi:hypothetical protein